MSKVLICGDQHFRQELPYSAAFTDGRASEWTAVLDKIIESAQDVDAVVLLGDNFDKRHNSSTVIREFITFLKRFPPDIPIHILAGNHERYGKETALDFLQKVDNPLWLVHTYPTYTQLVPNNFDVSGMFIPYITPAMIGEHNMEEAKQHLHNHLHKAELAFAHLAISGEKTDLFNEIVLPLDFMSKMFGFTFAGHVHVPERKSENVMVVGNIFTSEVGEKNKSVCTYDTVTKELTEIPLPTRGIYKVIVGAPEEVSKLIPIPANSIVKCVVTDRTIDIEALKEDSLSRFDAFVVVEQYPNLRPKQEFQSGMLDLSLENMLKEYADVKGLSYTELNEALNLVK